MLKQNVNNLQLNIYYKRFKKYNKIVIESTPEFKKKNISLQNLEILDLDSKNKKKNNKNISLINDILSENEDNENEQNLTISETKETTSNEPGRKLFWKKWV